MRRITVRISDREWRSIVSHARAGGLIEPDGSPLISTALRDLIARGLAPSDRSTEAGYRSGFAAGRVAGLADVMRRLAGGAP